MSTTGGVLADKNIAELRSYLPIPPVRTREFWTKWKIQHVRQLSTTGRATTEPVIPESERAARILDRLHIKGARRLGGSLDGIKTSVPFAAGSDLVLSSPLYLGDMSFGALSGIPNIAIARAADAAGVLAGTGEGGLLEEVARCSRITTQWASARFGVDISSLRKGEATVIKIGQGAKPGIGGHLPGIKVTEPISQTRRIPTGRDAISPAPHHDIYSIEDLGQRILALKEATRKPVFVKVGATNYIPYIASGVARMGAEGIIIDGSGAGTGAAPSVVKNNVGIPIELATACVDTILRKEGLRKGFTVISAGRVSTPEDSIKLMALGADITSLGTATLMALGCLMVHKCHLGYCPALLTNKITPNQVRTLSLSQSVVWLTNLVNGWTEEMKVLLTTLGVSDIRELTGRRDLLECRALNDETASILSIGTENTSSVETPRASWAPVSGDVLWSTPRIAMLREIAGTTGKFPAEPQISSMGTNSPPFIEEPVRLSDWLVCDGAQVTRPSIDPYREEIETSTFIAGVRIRLSSPFYFTRLPIGTPRSMFRVFARAAMGMGLLFDVGSTTEACLQTYRERLISDLSSTLGSDLRSISVSQQSSTPYFGLLPSETHENAPILLVRCPTSRERILALVEHPDLTDHFAGVILDEDEEGSDIQLEMAVTLLDRELKERGLRSGLNILAASNGVRGSDDIFKLVALGADCVGLGKAALIGVGIEEGDDAVVVDSNVSRRLEDFIIATQREIKLLAGAAGVSSVSSSLTGNRELLRAIDLEPSIRMKLGVKPAGAS